MRRTESRSREYIPEEKLRELERKRQQWKKITEYEERRARELALKKRRRKSKSRSRSRSRSRSKSSRRRSKSRSRSRDRIRSSHVPISSTSSATAPVMSEKCDASSSNTPLFKGREGNKIDSTDLKKIKVTIERDIASNSEDTSTQLLREIVNPDEIVVKRREGEGSKPIFEREELKHAESTGSEVAERRTIVAVDSTEKPDRGRTLSRHSRSHSPRRHSSYSSHRSESTMSLSWKIMASSTKPEMAYIAVPDLCTLPPPILCINAIGGIITRMLASLHGHHLIDCYKCIQNENIVYTIHEVYIQFLTSAMKNTYLLVQLYRHQSPKESASERYGVPHKRNELTHRTRDTFHRPAYHSDSHRSHRSLSRDETSRFYHDPAHRHQDRGEYSFARQLENQASSYRRDDALPYPESMAYPMYYDNYARPMMMDPMMMMRTPLPIVRPPRIPPMMSSFGPPPRPRLPPSDVYRFNIPPNQRYNRMF